MLIVESIRLRNVFLIPPIITHLRASDQQHGNAPRIKGVEYAIGLTSVLNPKLSEVPVPGTRDLTRLGEGQLGPFLLQEPHNHIDGILLLSIEGIPPAPELPKTPITSV